MLSIVIPICNTPELADECTQTLQENAQGNIEIIVIDNGSEVPYKNNNVHVVRNEKNKGFWPSMMQGIETAKNNHVFCMHSDVFIWEKAFDIRLLSHFAKDHKLAIAGLFGGRGVGLDGGRGHPEGNMVARKYGMNMDKHGYWQKESHPAVVFDSLGMCYRRDYLMKLSPETLPMHHWCDRLVTLRAVFNGYHCRTVGIEFDHGSGFTSSLPAKNNAMKEWCEEKGLGMVENWDMTVYMYGLAMFQREYQYVMGDDNQLWVDENYSYRGLRVQ